MLNVLVNAYAVSPAWGSEPGMGWNWVVNLARYCNVFVITEGEWRGEIEEAVEKLPQRGNLHFAGCAGTKATGVSIGTTAGGKSAHSPSPAKSLPSNASMSFTSSI